MSQAQYHVARARKLDEQNQEIRRKQDEEKEAIRRQREEELVRRKNILLQKGNKKVYILYYYEMD